MESERHERGGPSPGEYGRRLFNSAGLQISARSSRQLPLAADAKTTTTRTARTTTTTTAPSNWKEEGNERTMRRERESQAGLFGKLAGWHAHQRWAPTMGRASACPPSWSVSVRAFAGVRLICRRPSIGMDPCDGVGPQSVTPKPICRPQII